MIQYNKKPIVNGIINGELIKNITDNNKTKLLENNNIYIKDFYDKNGEFVQFRVAQFLNITNDNNIKNYLLLFLRNKPEDILTYISTIEVNKDFKLSRAQQLINGLGNRGINTIESYYDNISNFEKVIQFNYKQLTNSNFNITSDISFILGEVGFNKILFKETPEKLFVTIHNEKTSELGSRQENLIIFQNFEEKEYKCFTFEGITYYFYSNSGNYYVIEANKYTGEQLIQFNNSNIGYFYINDNKFEVTLGEDNSSFELYTKSYFLCMLDVEKQGHTWSILSLPYESNGNIEFFICIFLKDSNVILDSKKFQYELDFIDKNNNIINYEDKTFDLYDYTSNASLVLRDGDFSYPEAIPWSFPMKEYNQSLDEPINFPLNIMNSKYNKYIAYDDFDYSIGKEWFNCTNNNQLITENNNLIKLGTGVIDIDKTKNAKLIKSIIEENNYIYYKIEPNTNSNGDIIIKSRNKITISILNNTNSNYIYLRCKSELKDFIDIFSKGFKVEEINKEDIVLSESNKTNLSKDFAFTPCEGNVYINQNKLVSLYSKIEEKDFFKGNNIIEHNIVPSGQNGGFIGIACYLFGEKISNNNQWLDSNLFTVKEINIVNIDNNIYEIEDNKLINIENKIEIPFNETKSYRFSNQLTEDGEPICWEYKDYPEVHKYIKGYDDNGKLISDYPNTIFSPSDNRYNFSIKNPDPNAGDYYIEYDQDDKIKLIGKKENIYNKEHIINFIDFDTINKCIKKAKVNGVEITSVRTFIVPLTIKINNVVYSISQDDEQNYIFEEVYRINEL